MGWQKAGAGTKIAVWLSTASGVGVNCRVDSVDGTTEIVHLISVSMREGQREITERLITEGFTPLDRGFDEFFGFLGGGHIYLPRPKTSVIKKGKRMTINH